MSAARRSSIASDICDRTFDESAETIEELAAETGMGRMWVQQRANDMVRRGEWERVFKLVPRANGHYPAAAYRRKKNPPK